jgi:L-lactate dehydrogenase
VDALVLGEHGTSQVFLWSAVRVSGVPLASLPEAKEMQKLQDEVEREVRYANITIIEGTGASVYGISVVSARIAEMVLRDERTVIPIGSFNKDFGATLSLPSIVGRHGVERVLLPEMSQRERELLDKSALSIRNAAA